MKAENTVKNYQVKQEGIWSRFIKMIKAADIPKGLLVFYIFLYVIEGQILIRIPQINGNFFAGDVSPKSVGLFIFFELLTTAVCQVVLYVNHILRYRMNRNLRNVLWIKILLLKPAYYDKVSPSSLVSRITTDADSINTFILDVVFALFYNIYILVITIAEMSKVSIKVGLMLLVFMPVTLILSFVFGRIQMKFENRIKASLADFTSYLSEIISVLPLLKSLNRQEFETKRGEEVIEQYYIANRKAVYLTILSDFIHGIADIGPELVIFILGIRYLKDGTFDATAWYMFYVYAGTFIAFCGTLGSMWTNAKGIQGSLYKVTDVMNEEGECLADYVSEIVAAGDILFDDVSFSYDETPVVEHADFSLKEGKTNMLIGPSGAGKSTLLKLLERLYEPDSGRILMGGQVINQLPIRSYRENVAYVSQRTPLFSGSIRDNILYGIKREVKQEEIDRVCQLARLEDFLKSLEDGLEHQVGEFGGRLSGGQKQKISIARALLSNASILILDEPTASLDISATEEFMETIEMLKGKKTVVIVSHDPQVIRKGDHILVVNKDHSIDQGTHSEIGRISEFYRKLMKGKEVS